MGSWRLNYANIKGRTKGDRVTTKESESELTRFMWFPIYKHFKKCHYPN